MKFTNHTTYRNITLHFTGWLVYIVYELFLILFIYHIKTPFKSYIFFYACNIGLFYWHFHILDRYLNRTPARHFLMTFIILAEICLIMAIKLCWDYYFVLNNVPGSQSWAQLKKIAGLDLNRTIYYIYFSTVLWSAINFGKFNRKTAEALIKSTLADKAATDLRFQFAEAQNAFLKQQINPHFLFNALNAIYSKFYQIAPEESKSVLLLSEIMRYSFEDAGPNGRVPLANELVQLERLIELNSYRFEKTINLELKVQGDANPHKIIPLVLITLTENMFKHGDLRLNPRSLEIYIDANGQMTYISKNVPKLTVQSEPNTHVGLKNTQLRLDYAYPNNYNLQLTETDELFTLELNINLAYDRSNY